MTNYRYRSQKYRKTAKGKKVIGHQNFSKKKKMSLGNRFFWLFVLILIFLGIIFYFFFFSSLFQVKNIDIYGNPRVKEPEIRDMVNQEINRKIFFVIPRNIFFINSNKIEKSIKDKFSYLEEVEIKKKFFRSLVVNMEGRILIGVWCNDLECFRLDDQGIVFEQGKKQAKLIIKSDKEVILGEKIIEKEYLDKIMEIMRELETEEFFVPEKEEKLTAKMKEGWEAYFNPQKEISSQILNLKLILKEKISQSERENLEYIDLRFGDRLFYRFR